MIKIKDYIIAIEVIESNIYNGNICIYNDVIIKTQNGSKMIVTMEDSKSMYLGKEIEVVIK